VHHSEVILHIILTHISFPTDCDLSVTAQNTTPPGESECDSSGNSIVDVGMEDMDVIWQSVKTAQTKDGADLPNKEQWLALRVHGGSRNWLKFSSCFP